MAAHSQSNMAVAAPDALPQLSALLNSDRQPYVAVGGPFLTLVSSCKTPFLCLNE